MNAAPLIAILLASATVEDTTSTGVMFELLNVTPSKTQTLTAPGRSVTLTIAQPLSSGVQTVPGYELTLGALVRQSGSSDLLFASGFEGDTPVPLN